MDVIASPDDKEKSRSKLERLSRFCRPDGGEVTQACARVPPVNAW